MKGSAPLFLVILLLGTPVRAEDALQSLEGAIAFQNAAISRYEQLARKTAVSSSDTSSPANLVRLMEAISKGAALEYQAVNLRNAKRGRASSDGLNAFLALQKKMIQASSEFLRKFPKDPDAPTALLFRAKANKELSLTVDAIADFKKLLAEYPKAEEVPVAAFTLSDLQVSVKDFAGAREVLNRNLGLLDPSLQILALDRLAWAEYHLGELDKALEHLSSELTQLRKMKEQLRDSPPEMKSAFETAALVFAAGSAQGKTGYTASGAIKYFELHGAPADYAGAIRHLAYHLAAKEKEDELRSLIRIVMEGPLRDLAGHDILQVALEHQMNKRLYADLRESLGVLSTRLLPAQVKTARDLSEAQTRLRKSLLNVTAQLQAAFNRPEVKKQPELERTQGELLLQAYGILLRTGEASARNVGTYRNNLAEAAFRLKQYELSATNYLWLAKYSKGGLKIPGFEKLFQEIRTKAIVARYHELKSKGLVPEKLNTAPFEATPPVAPAATLTPQVQEWVALVETAYAEEKSALLADYVFEAQRLLYSQGQVASATKRLAELVQEQFDFPNAVAAASLVLDTYLVSGHWEDAKKIADRISASNPKDANFTARLVQVSQDAAFKGLEAGFQAGAYARVIESVHAGLKDGARNWGRHYNAALAFAGNSALALGNRKVASQYFARIPRAGASEDVLALTFLTQASAAEEDMNFAVAAESYRSYFRLSPATLQKNGAELPGLKQKSLLVAWLSARVELLDELLRSEAVCSPDLVTACERFKAVSVLSGSRTFRGFKTLQTVSAENRYLLATALLTSDSPQELAAALPIVAEGSTSDPLLRFTTLASLSRQLPAALTKHRLNYRRSSPVQLSKDSINRRLAQVRNHEELLSKFANSPWIRVRALARNELALAYGDLVEDLRRIPPPKGVGPAEAAAFRKTLVDLTLPFEGKAAEARESALAVALEGAIEPETLSLPARAEHTVLQALRALEINVIPAGDARGMALRSQWSRALAANHWPLVAFIIQSAKAQGQLDGSTAAAALGVALFKAGARSEGLRELAEAREQLREVTRNSADLLLIAAYFNSSNPEKTRWALSRIPQQLNADAARLVTDAVAWSGTELQPEMRARLEQSSFGRRPASTDADSEDAP